MAEIERCKRLVQKADEKTVQLKLRVAELESKLRRKDEVLVVWAELIGRSGKLGSLIEVEESAEEDAPRKVSGAAETQEAESSPEEDEESSSDEESSPDEESSGSEE